MGKHVSPPPSGPDLVQALQSFREDSGCEARVILVLDKNGVDLIITTEAYTDHGARIGVARDVARYSENGRPVLGQILASIFRTYAQASRQAHADDVKHPSLRRR